ncbi:transposase [Catenuloplanes nepalensis]|uniref:Transposase n=1 Tax=Catenuloplanes nepalensis TaxID=587533 RepID=A0ABT9MQL4_9ACTN|nr:DUF6444 domain-containing protein [Catenuloplanes nepalensis]MDP9793721.1 transposase [Catenuloplanes nepalensis]
MEQLVAVVTQLQAEVQRLRVVNEQLRAQNAVLRAENAVLRRRLGMNSSNSSMPPSSDGLARPRPQPGAKAGGRRRGKQPGAPGSTLRLAEDPDRVVQHRPDRCAGPACGADLGDGREYGRQQRQVLELPDCRPVVVEHQLIAVQCAECAQVSEPVAPAVVTGRVQYGTGVKAAAVYARAAQFLPFARVAGLLGDLLGVRVSTGFVHQVVGEAARRLGGVRFPDRGVAARPAGAARRRDPGEGRRRLQVRARGLHP